MNANSTTAKNSGSDVFNRLVCLLTCCNVLNKRGFASFELSGFWRQYVLSFWVWGLLHGAGLGLALANPGPELTAYEGRRVREVLVQDPTGLSNSELERLLDLPQGSELSSSAIRGITKRLYGLQRFRQVSFYGWPVGSEEVSLLLQLDPNRVLGEVRLMGGDAVGRDQVLDLLELSVGERVEQRDLEVIEDRLVRVLAHKGWRSAQVRLSLENLDDKGRVVLNVNIEAGYRTRLGQVRLKGRVPFPLWSLDVGIKPNGVLDLEPVKSALSRLQERLRRQAYWDVQIAPPRVLARSEDATLADLLVEVDLGPKVEVRIEGNRRLSKRRLREDTQILSELGTSADVLIEAKDRMLARYERYGHYRAIIDVAARTSLDDRKREVLFRINEGPPSRVVGLRFPGAVSFSSHELRAQVVKTVERYLGTEESNAGVDPLVVDQMVFGQSPRLPRDTPSTSPPTNARVYIPRAYRTAADVLSDMYRLAGYQMVRIERPQVRYRARSLIEVEYAIEEGPRWMLGSVVFTGHDGDHPSTLLKLSGMELSPDKPRPHVFEEVERGRRSILKWYRDRGYVFAQVTEELRKAPFREEVRGNFFSESSSVMSLCVDELQSEQPTCDVEVVYNINKGPRVRVGRIRVQGLKHTRLSVVEGEYEFRQGDYLSATKMEQTRNNLVRLGVFDRVDVRIEQEDQQTNIKNIIVDVVPRKNISVEVGGGASTEEGLRLFSSLIHRNLFGTALKLQANAKVNFWASPLLALYDESIRQSIEDFYRDEASIEEGRAIVLTEYEFSAGISYPRIFLLPTGFSFGLDVVALRNFEPIFREDTRRLTLGANYDGLRPQLFGKERPFTFQVRLGLEDTELQCNNRTGLATEDEDRPLCSSVANPQALSQAINADYISVSPRVSIDFRDDALLPSKGVFLELEGEYAEGLSSDSPNYIRSEGRLNVYVPLPLLNRITLVNSLRGGYIEQLESGEIPLNRLFFSGGRSTIRGFAERTLLPQDVPLDNSSALPALSISPGGRLYGVLKSELRLAIAESLSVAGFYDIGDLWSLDPSTGCMIKNLVSRCVNSDGTSVTRRLAQGVGFGLRLVTPVGPLTIDLGFPVHTRRRQRLIERRSGTNEVIETSRINRFQFHFSIGTF